MKQLTLQELNSIIKSVLKKGLDSSYWIVAEISELRINSTGHCYLELVEKQGQQILAKSKATIWANTYTNLSLWFEKMTGSQLKEGMKILCNTTIQYHEVYGLSLSIQDIDANFTIGEKAATRQKTINQLTEEGVLTMNKELPINLVLQNIAVISSPTAAGYGDFIDQLKSNSFGYQFNVKLYDAVMQGNLSAASIIDALLKIYENDNEYDLIVITRGGGSQIDLDSYDSYELSAHIAQFPTPVITGIGHERDESVADIVAYVSLKTPTAVAEYIIDRLSTYEGAITESFQSIHLIAKESINTYKQDLLQLSKMLEIASKSLILTKEYTFSSLSNELQNVTRHYISNQKQQLKSLQYNLEILSPENILKRGYSMTTNNGQLIKEDTVLNKGDKLITETYNYTINSTVTEKKMKA